ncbi:MAG: hypothetical protein ABIR33_06280 [Pyrinomonadaceae bacterium]
MVNALNASQGGCVWEIDSEDRIVFCDKGWDIFAAENEGDDLRFQSIEGKVIWDFIGDPSTTDLYKRMVERVRKGVVVRFDLRCDSPKLIRLLEIMIRKIPTDRVQFSSHVKRTQARGLEKGSVQDTVEFNDPLIVCSWCSRVKVDEHRWQDVDVAMGSVKVFERNEVAPLSHGICGDCLAGMDGLLTGAKPKP